MRLLACGFFLQIDCHCLNHRNLLRFLFANKQVKVGKHVEVVTSFMDKVQNILHLRETILIKMKLYSG